MSAASTKATPRHTVQFNKTALALKASNGNGPVRDSNAVIPSIASRRKKFSGSNLARPLHRDVNISEAQSQQATALLGQKQRPSTARASCEKSLEEKSNGFLRHSSCELRENLGEELQTAIAPFPQRSFFSPSSPDPLQSPSRRERCSEFGTSMRDMSESLSKIEELIFPSKAGQEVVMRENMAFEASPVHSSDFPELEGTSIKPSCRSPLATSHSRNSDGDLEMSETAGESCVRKQRRPESALKGRRRKGRCHEKSQSCDNKIPFQEEVNRRWTLTRSSAEFSSSSVPLFGDRSDSDSAASNEESRDAPAPRRRWPKVTQFFSSTAVRTCRDHSTSKSESSFLETDSTTTQVETELDALTEQSDTSGRSMGRSLSKIGKSRRLEDSNLAEDRRTANHECAAIELGGETEKPLDTVLNEKQNHGFEEENEVLYKNACCSRVGTGIEQIYGDHLECSFQLAKESECSSSSETTFERDTTMIVLPTSSVSYGQTTLAKTTAPAQVEQNLPQQHTETQLLFPTKETPEQASNGSKCNLIRSPSKPQLEHHKEHGLTEMEMFAGAEVCPPHTKNQIHPLSSEKVLPHKHLSFYFEDSSSASESADEKHVYSSGAPHQDELDSESRDVFDIQCDTNRSGSLKMCTPKAVDVEEKAPSSIVQASQPEEKYMHASLSTEKLCSILSYLGQVEQSNFQENAGISAEKGTPRGACFYSPRENGSPRTVLEHAEDAVSLTSSSQTAHSNFQLSAEGGVDPRPSNCNPAIAATTVFDGVRKKVQELKQKIAEQEAKIAELKAENDKLIREREQHMLMEREKYHKQLEDQAAEYKVIIQHHLSVNEKMLRDKEQLSEKCCNLAGILSVAESKFDEKVKQLAEQWSREMKKAKEIWSVGEKQRQKQWQEKKIKDLKETAIRGLEPHLDNLNEKHRQELAKQEARHAEELLSKLDAQNLEYRRQACQLRDHLQQERDKMLDNERLAAHSRMAIVAEKFEQQAIQQRMRVATEITAQLDRSEAGRREDKQYSQELFARLQKEVSEREETLRKQMEKNAEDMAMKKDRQIEQLKSQMVAVSHQFQQKFNDRVNEGMKEKEKELRAKLLKERDEQIELVIEKLESEKEELIAQNKKEVTKKENEILTAKREVEQELKEFKSKFAELSNVILSHKAETEMELEDAEKKNTSLRRETQHQTRVIEELHNQVSQHKAMLKNQEEVFEARLKDEQTQLQQIQSDLHQSNSKADEMRTRKVLLIAQNIMVEELAEVEAQVRQAIVKKDVVIANLREQLLTAHRQIKATEYLLQREHNAFVRES